MSEIVTLECTSINMNNFLWDNKCCDVFFYVLNVFLRFYMGAQRYLELGRKDIRHN